VAEQTMSTSLLQSFLCLFIQKREKADVVISFDCYKRRNSVNIMLFVGWSFIIDHFVVQVEQSVGCVCVCLDDR